VTLAASAIIRSRYEESVGRALRDSGVPRDEVFITTKFNPGRKDPVAEAQQSLRRLGVDQVNLYLVHWPEGGATWAWAGMERARELGFACSVGVSNVRRSGHGLGVSGGDAFSERECPPSAAWSAGNGGRLGAGERGPSP
jgi:hypothetical protein